MIEVKRKDKESVNSLIYRFTKKVQQSGLIKEAKKKQFHGREPNERARRESRLYRLRKTAEIKELRKLGRL